MLKHEIKMTEFIDMMEKGNGIATPKMYFNVEDESGIVSFALFTNWVTKKHEMEYWKRNRELFPSQSPTVIGVFYHSHARISDGDFHEESCSFFSDRECYYSRIGINEDDVFDLLLTDGLDELWNFLENQHMLIFGKPQNGSEGVDE